MDFVPTNMEPEQFSLVKNGSKRRKDLVVSDLGFSFGFKVKTHKESIWTCTVRRKGCYCHARLSFNGERYKMLGRHIHDGQPGLLAKINITKQVKL